MTTASTTEYQLVTSTEQLHQALAPLRAEPALAVDTEFERSRTFFPRLALVQVRVEGGPALLIDPLAVGDLEALGELLAEPSIVKVMHSAGEDLEVLYHRFGAFPQTLFDTQVAATFLGPGPAPGYGRLVREIFGPELDKEAQRTEWLRRPLDPAQLGYAAQDVAYLLPLWKKLSAELQDKGRDHWLQEDLQQLMDAERFLPDPETLYLRNGLSRHLPRRQLALLAKLVSWREQQARKRDLPRGFVLPDGVLTNLAKRPPRNRHQLAQAGPHPKILRRDGDTLLHIVRSVGQLSEGDLPPALSRPPNLQPHKALVQKLRQQVARRAEALGVAPEVLASRKVVERLLARVLSRRSEPLPEELRGWRREEIGEQLLAMAQRQFS